MFNYKSILYFLSRTVTIYDYILDDTNMRQLIYIALKAYLFVLETECCICATPSKLLEIYKKQVDVHLFLYLGLLSGISAQLNKL